MKYAVFAAETTLHIYEKRYPGNDKPRKAIEAAKAYLKNPCKKTTAAAYAAAAAAYAAADAAADAAAYAADAAKKELQRKIINNGIKILKGSK